MNIVSLLYLAFVAVVALAYFITPRRFRWVTLLVASVANYLSYDLKLAVWLFITSVTIYVGGLLIDRQEQRYAAQLKERADLDRAGKRALKKQNERVKRRWAALVAAVNIAIWVVFKFADLFITTLNKYLSGNLSLWHLMLPLGISFYTLQAISYVVDLSRGKCEVQRNYFRLLLWLCFFPQMLQGPICRYRETAPQLYEPHDFDYRRVKFGMQRMLWGYFKKLVIADRVVKVSEKVFGNSGNYQGLVFIIGALAYTIQIYADFSGGMDIIGGAAEILGVNMPVNFERPYFSKSISEYWRRWHITLGAWFRDYVFYPLSISKWAQKLTTSLRKRLGPNIAKMIPTYLAMVLVWMLNGIWHGAGWQFVAFGMYQGILIVLGMQFEPVFDWIIAKLKINTNCFSWRLWQMVRTLALIMGGRIIFKASGLYEAMRIGWSILKVHNIWIFTDGTLFKLGLNAWELFLLFVAVLVLLTVSILQEKGYHIREAIERQNLVFRWLLYIAAIATVILFGVYGPSYDAAGFVYAGF